MVIPFAIEGSNVDTQLKQGLNNTDCQSVSLSVQIEATVSFTECLSDAS